ncbi:hypothetical protein LMF32_12955 [Desemzia sp. C1]|uniref:hypothetical protein n=1 Tax=Desemzia sp. C1 TaxID=2892016 RepID=UPI001E2E10C7|nr:hypothetical protein [Desemzia sp. C1]MCI3029953.1 hypothetical protein [Desemzia sp. C1]
MWFFILVIIVVGIASANSKERGEGEFGCIHWILAILFCFVFPPIVPFVLLLLGIGLVINFFSH